MNHSSASERRKIEQYKDVRAAAEAMAGAQVDGAPNFHGDEHVATVLPDETIAGGGGGEEDASWVPDQDTGVFVPADADADTHGSGAHPAPPQLYEGISTDGSASVLDQAVFVREENMEDVERPAAIDMANANADVNNNIKNY